MSKKISPKIEYIFQDQEDFAEFNLNTNIKTKAKYKSKIIEHKKKKKEIDVSTKLF